MTGLPQSLLKLGKLVSMSDNRVGSGSIGSDFWGLVSLGTDDCFATLRTAETAKTINAITAEERTG